MNTKRTCEYCSESFATTEKNNCPEFKIIEGDLFHTIRNAKRIENFLSFCQSLFWSDENFPEEQKMQYRTLIAQHFSNEIHGRDTFLELVERAVLAKRYVSAHPGRYIPEARLWLDKNYPYGLAGTQAWRARMNRQRKTLPLYNIGISVLAAAIYDLYENDNCNEINLYRNYFTSTKQSDLFQIYINSVIHSQYIKL